MATHICLQGMDCLLAKAVNGPNVSTIFCVTTVASRQFRCEADSNWFTWMQWRAQGSAKWCTRAKSGQTALDDFLGDQTWHTWDDKDASEFGRLAVEHFCNSLQGEGFINTRHVSVPETNPLYRFTLFSRHTRGEDFWLKILKTDEKGQRELL